MSPTPNSVTDNWIGKRGKIYKTASGALDGMLIAAGNFGLLGGVELDYSMNIRRRPERRDVWRTVPPLRVRNDKVIAQLGSAFPPFA